MALLVKRAMFAFLTRLLIVASIQLRSRAILKPRISFCVNKRSLTVGDS
jgi:hypothetical protein